MKGYGVTKRWVTSIGNGGGVQDSVISVVVNLTDTGETTITEDTTLDYPIIWNSYLISPCGCNVQPTLLHVPSW